MNIAEQIVVAAIFYFGKVFVFCRAGLQTFLVENISDCFDKEEKVGRCQIIISFMIKSICPESYNEFLESYCWNFPEIELFD